MDRVILHCDMNGFFASVELIDRPDLKNKPMAVCGNPENRHGIILAKNEIAKSYGVVTAETLWQARKKCPKLEVVPPHMEKYKDYSAKINEIYLRFTDLVEPFSIDESWLDVTGSQKLFGTGREIADTIRETVKKELGLTLSAGVSYNKIFAKMGSEYKKPDATTEITRENYKELLWPMDVGELLFVGKVTANKLRKIGIMTIGDLAKANTKTLTSLLGKQGSVLYEYANGYENTPVCQYSHRQQIKSVGNGITFKRNLNTIDDIITAATSLSDTVGSRLRKYGLKCNGIKVDIKDPYFKVISRQKGLDMPTNLTEEIYSQALNIIQSSWNIENPIRMLTITAINLQDDQLCEQLYLFSYDEGKRKKSGKIDETIDSIRTKFGDSSITFGPLINNDLGIDIYDEEKEIEDT